MALYPYLTFGGTCREAFTRYQEVFGGELEVMALGDLPAEDAAGLPPDAADQVMHAALRFGDDLLMGSDDPWGGFDGFRGVSVNVTVTDVGEAERLFAALAEGGEVGMALEATFWSPAFGTCTDRFGVPWMVNAEPAEAT